MKQKANWKCAAFLALLLFIPVCFAFGTFAADGDAPHCKGNGVIRENGTSIRMGGYEIYLPGEGDRLTRRYDDGSVYDNGSYGALVTAEVGDGPYYKVCMLPDWLPGEMTSGSTLKDYLRFSDDPSWEQFVQESGLTAEEIGTYHVHGVRCSLEGACYDIYVYSGAELFDSCIMLPGEIKTVEEGWVDGMKSVYITYIDNEVERHRLFVFNSESDYMIMAEGYDIHSMFDPSVLEKIVENLQVKVTGAVDIPTRDDGRGYLCA